MCQLASLLTLLSVRRQCFAFLQIAICAGYIRWSLLQLCQSQPGPGVGHGVVQNNHFSVGFNRGFEIRRLQCIVATLLTVRYGRQTLLPEHDKSRNCY